MKDRVMITATKEKLTTHHFKILFLAYRVTLSVSVQQGYFILKLIFSHNLFITNHCMLAT